MDEWSHGRALLLRHHDCGCRQELQGGPIHFSTNAFGDHSNTWASLKSAINLSPGFGHKVQKPDSGQIPANTRHSFWIENWKVH
jgi:hypothetical protein